MILSTSTPPTISVAHHLKRSVDMIWTKCVHSTNALLHQRNPVIQHFQKSVIHKTFFNKQKRRHPSLACTIRGDPPRNRDSPDPYTTLLTPQLCLVDTWHVRVPSSTWCCDSHTCALLVMHSSKNPPMSRLPKRFPMRSVPQPLPRNGYHL